MALRTHLFAAATVVSLAACGGGNRRAFVDPVVNLQSHSRIGLVTFTAENARGGLATLATQKFEEQLLRAQPGIEILDLGVVTGPIDAAKAKALGAQHGVRTIAVGTLTLSDIKPRVRILGGLSASTEVTVALSTKFLSAESGATLWSRSSTLKETLHAVSMVNGTAVFDAQDPQEAYGEMVNDLVWNVTTDFRGTWVRQ